VVVAVVVLVLLDNQAEVVAVLADKMPQEVLQHNRAVVVEDLEMLEDRAHLVGQLTVTLLQVEVAQVAQVSTQLIHYT
jgi:hypothetical protein